MARTKAAMKAWEGPQEIKIGSERAVVVPLDLWRKVLEDLEDLYDLGAYEQARAEMEGETEADWIEHDELCRLLGRSPLRYLRNRAGMNQSALAKKTGLSQSYIARVESGQRKLSLAAARKIARVLKVEVEKLMV
jgi:DNA-binding XRE family transcriptional regulator